MGEMPDEGARSGIDRNSFPMRLWRKAKLHGIWNPDSIDFTRDCEDWRRLAPEQQDRMLQLCAMFHGGEEAVTTDLLPLIRVLAAEGRLEEEMYLTSFLWEEAKHLDMFDRFFSEVAGGPRDLSRFLYPSYRSIFAEELPRALRVLDTDPSPEAQVRAAVTYNIVVEGVLAEAGYFLFSRSLRHSGVLPGLYQAIRMLRRDESRHIAFGVYLIRRLIVENGDRAYRAFLDRMGELKPMVEASTREFVGFFEGSDAFGVELPELMRYSQRRSAGRLQRIVDARTESLTDLRASPRRSASGSFEAGPLLHAL
jgi:ribonucleoside-diphosphate reductase beta chain